MPPGVGTFLGWRCAGSRPFREVEFVVQRKVGMEPVNYVSNIYKYYIAYTRIRDRALETEAAEERLRERPTETEQAAPTGS